jgi:hypothetical protein
MVITRDVRWLRSFGIEDNAIHGVAPDEQSEDVAMSIKGDVLKQYASPRESNHLAQERIVPRYHNRTVRTLFITHLDKSHFGLSSSEGRERMLRKELGTKP